MIYHNNTICKQKPSFRRGNYLLLIQYVTKVRLLCDSSTNVCYWVLFFSEKCLTERQDIPWLCESEKPSEDLKEVEESNSTTNKQVHIKNFVFFHVCSNEFSQGWKSLYNTVVYMIKTTNKRPYYNVQACLYVFEYSSLIKNGPHRIKAFCQFSYAAIFLFDSIDD